jgi:hypothetical protein
MDELERLPDEDQLADRGRQLVAHAVGGTRAPLSLRQRLEDDRAAAARPRRRAGVPAWAAGLLAAVAVVAVAVVLLAGGSDGAGGPTVVGVADVAAAPPTAAAPRPTGYGYVDVRVGTVRFPDWTELQWPATGQRTDRVAGRMVRTVIYTAPDGTRAGYSIVAGPALAAPAGREHRVRGRVYRVLTVHGDRVVTWERDGHTCVLRAPAEVPASRLVQLAAWHELT